MSDAKPTELMSDHADLALAGRDTTPLFDPPLVSISPIGPGDVLRLPSLDDLAERPVAQANERRRHHANIVTESYLGRTLAFVLECLDAAPRDTEPMEWAMPTPWTNPAEIYGQMDRLVRHDDTRPGRLTIGLQGADPGVTDELSFDTTYALHRPNVNQIASTLAGGASVVLRAAGRHLAEVNELITALETLLGAPCEADVVLFGPSSVHVDPASRGGAVIVLPVDVELHATVESKSSEANDDSNVVPDPAVTEPGPSGCIPPGSVVASRSDQSLRLHAETPGTALRIVLPVPTAAQLRMQGAKLARHHPLLRADLPVDLDAPIESYDGSLYSHPGAFHAEASLALGHTPTMHALASLRAHVPTRSTAGLFANRRALSGPLPNLRAGVPGGITLTGATDQQVLAAGGMTVRIDPLLAQLLVPHLDGEPFDPTPIINAFAPTPDRDNADTDGDGGNDHSNRAVEALELLIATEILEVAS